MLHSEVADIDAGERHEGARSVPCAARATVIEARRRWEVADLTELWSRRELLYFLAWRDVKVRYRQTAIGGAWAVLQPLLTMGAFSVVFGSLLHVPSDGAPYVVFSYAGLLPWSFFTTALGRSGTSLVSNTSLISKVYFPRLIVPISAVLASAVDFAVAFIILVGLLVVYAIPPGVAVLALPAFMLLALTTVLGAGLWLSALNVKYRDVGYAVPFLLQVWLFVTPVVYPTSILPERWRLIYALNPMSGVVEGFRWALLGTPAPAEDMLLVGAIVAFSLLLTGVLYFRRVEDEFADVV